MVKIVQLKEPVLRQIAKEVPLSEIGTPKIKKIIEDMKTAVDSCEDGVALAAPQIGVSLRIFVVSPKAILYMEQNKKGCDAKACEDSITPKTENAKHLVFINPKIIKLSAKKNKLEEGCLSVRGIYGTVRRAEKATVEAYDENGKKVTRGGSGLMAEIFQHETDHLNGILFVDTAKDLFKLEPPVAEQNKNENPSPIK